MQKKTHQLFHHEPQTPQGMIQNQHVQTPFQKDAR